MKRRKLFSLGLSSLIATAGQHYLPNFSTDLTAKASFAKSANGTASKIANALQQASGSEEALFKFAVAGDVGTGKKGQYNVAKAMTQHWQASPYSFTLLAGDNIYENGEIEKINRAFERPYAELLQNGVKFYAVLGNHDIRDRQGEDQIAYPGYNMPSRYYTFTQSSVQFFGLDTNLAYAGDAQADWRDQLGWLRAELARSPARWKVVFAHHPIYASGRHGSDSGLAADLAPIFAEYGVQLYINGHEHHYERTQPIDGTTYITSGNGAKLRRVGRSDWTAFSKSQLGFTTFSVYPNHIVVSAIDTENTVYDEAVIM